MEVAMKTDEFDHLRVPQRAPDVRASTEKDDVCHEKCSTTIQCIWLHSSPDFVPILFEQ